MKTFCLIHNKHYNNTQWLWKVTRTDINDKNNIDDLHEFNINAVKKYGIIYINRSGGWCPCGPNDTILRTVKQEDFPDFV